MNKLQLSYEDLIDIIVNNKPVPESVEIPDIILDECERTESHLCLRVKPWEDIDVIDNSINSTDTIKDAKKELTEKLDNMVKTHSMEGLSQYYAIEAEFENHLKTFLDEDATKTIADSPPATEIR